MDDDPIEKLSKSSSNQALAQGLFALVKMEPTDRGDRYDGMIEEAARRLETMK